MVKNDLLSAPIPGMSLAVEPGNRPWEQPPKLTEVYEVVDYYTDRLTDPELIGNILDALREDAPVYEMVKGLVSYSMMKGIHSIDTGTLVIPVIVEMIKAIAELNDVGYVITQKDKDKISRIDPRIAERAVREVKETEMQRVDEDPIQPPKGLMGKGGVK